MQINNIKSNSFTPIFAKISPKYAVFSRIYVRTRVFLSRADGLKALRGRAPFDPLSGLNFAP